MLLLLLLCSYLASGVLGGCSDSSRASQDVPLNCLYKSGGTCYQYSSPDQFLTLVSNQPVAYTFIYTNGSTLVVDVLGGNATIVPNVNNGTGFIVNINAYSGTTSTTSPTTTPTTSSPTITSSSGSSFTSSSSSTAIGGNNMTTITPTTSAPTSLSPSSTANNGTSSMSPPTTSAPVAYVNSTSVTFTIRLLLDVATFNANFSSTFVSSLAQALGCNATRIHIKSVVAGSVIITTIIDAPTVSSADNTTTAQALVQSFLTQLNTTGSALRNISGWGNAIDTTYVSNITYTVVAVPVSTTPVPTTAPPTTTSTPTMSGSVSSSSTGRPNAAYRGATPSHWTSTTTLVATVTTSALYWMRNNHAQQPIPWLLTTAAAAATLASVSDGANADVITSTCPEPLLVTIYLPVYVDQHTQRRFSYNFSQAQIFNATCADPFTQPQLSTPLSFHPILGCVSFASTFTLSWSSPSNPSNCSNAIPTTVTLYSNQMDVISSGPSDPGAWFTRSDWFQHQSIRTWNTILTNGENGTVTAYSSGNENQAKDATFVAVVITTPTLTCHVAYACANGTCADAANTAVNPLRCAEFITTDNSTTCPRYNSTTVAGSGPTLSNPYAACPSLTCSTWCSQNNNSSACSSSACPAGYGGVNSAANPPITSICDSTGFCSCPTPYQNHSWNRFGNSILLTQIVFITVIILSVF